MFDPCFIRLLSLFYMKNYRKATSATYRQPPTANRNDSQWHDFSIL